jgi:hypothetical protein
LQPFRRRPGNYGRWHCKLRSDLLLRLSLEIQQYQDVALEWCETHEGGGELSVH